MSTRSQCPDCGRAVSDDTKVCPECGAPVGPGAELSPGQAAPPRRALAALSGEETEEIEIPDVPDTDTDPSSIVEIATVRTGRPTDVPSQKPRRPAGPRVRGRVKRRSYATLCQTLPGRPYLAMIGTGEPPTGYPIRHCLITIGRGLENQIVIDDPTLSRTHALLALVGSDFLVVDRSSEQRMLVNQRRVAQSKVTIGDVIEIGRRRLLFAVVPGTKLAWGYRLRPLWSEGAPPVEPQAGAGGGRPNASIILRNRTSIRQVKSDGSPILIGSDRTCRMPVKGGEVAAFHAQVYWGADGIYVRGLRSSCRVLVEGKPIRSVRVEPGQEIAIGQERFEVQFQGDVVAACRYGASRDDASRPFALTCVSGDAHGASSLLPPDDDPLLLGQDPLCDLHVDDPAVGPRQMFLTVRENHIDIENLSQDYPLRVNDQRVTSATVKPGDVVAVGRSEFLVHRAV